MKPYISIVILMSSFFFTLPLSYAQECTGSLPSQLFINFVTQVIEGNTLNIRTAPEQGNVIAQLPAGQDFQIIDGSICGAQDGLRWWFIDWNGTQGWIAEGDLTESWIVPPPAMFMGGVVFEGDEVEEVQPTTIPPTAIPQNTTGISINDLQYVNEDNGIRFWLDMSVTDYANHDLLIVLWFIDGATGEYITNPSAYEDYINSNGLLRLTYDLQPCCQSVTYGIGDIQIFLPYDQLPAGDSTFYPQVSVYDDNIELIEKREFTTLLLPNTAIDNTGATIHYIEHQFADEGMWFLVDMTVNNRINEDLSLYVWFRDEITGEFIQNPSASDDHRNNGNSVFTTIDLKPESNTQNYIGTDASLYIPYHEFPRNLTNYMPFVTLYDAELNEIAQQGFADVVIQPSDYPAPASGLIIRDVTPVFEETGVRLSVDMDAIGYANRDLKVYAYFRDYGEEYIHSALPDEGYYTTDKGLIYTETLISPSIASQAFTGDNQVELYVPYNVFPVGTYPYFPVIGISYVGDEDSLKNRFFRDKTIDVLGDEPPVGYFVNYRIDELYAPFTANGGGMANSGPEWDDLLLIYSLYEIDKTGQMIPGEQQFWTKYVWPRTRHNEDFETILLDIPASSNLVVRMEFTEVVDLESTEEAVDNLRQAGKLAKRGTRFLPRLFRIAAKSAIRYGNNMMLFYDIIAFFDEDRVLDVYERVIPSDELYTLYQSTGAVGREWFTDTVTSDSDNSRHSYELTLKYWLYGYAGHRMRE